MRGALAAGLFAALAGRALAGCASDPAPLAITGVAPPYAPLVGGTQITIAVSGFAAGPGDAAQVLIGGREAPLARFHGRSQLDVIVPPGDLPGAADVVVLVGDRVAQARGRFHYSTPPTLESVSPRDLSSLVATPVIAHGHGFLDEDAGVPSLAVDGRTTHLVITRDDELSFSVPPGRPLATPALDFVNRRGHVTLERAFRYVPAPHAGLLLFGSPTSWAAFYDPAEGTVLPITRVAGAAGPFSSIIRDDGGQYWAASESGRLGAVHPSTQAQEPGVATGRGWPAMAWVGGAALVIDSFDRVGWVDLANASFAPIGATIPCCGSVGLAYDGTTVYVAAPRPPPDPPPADDAPPGDVPAVIESRLYQVDVDSGELGAWVDIDGPPSMRIEELRFLNGVLYAGTTDGLFTIDPATGTARQVVDVGEVKAMEVWDSGSAN
ncbi:MAG TPA: IPT/TIG domain-containing protein [Kofleriaceae bacterium]|nr:IPT/TIG domain-containing protein [Kofleriaceae bacterium]